MFLLILVSAVFGLSIGLYDLLLPLFLDHMHISYGNMGVIFSFSAILLFFSRIYAGHISDIIGRKHVFSLSILFCSIANLFTPFSINVIPQIILRSLRESSRVVKETTLQLLIFDKWKDRFRYILAWMAGIDATFQGIGAILTGFLLVRIGYKYPFILAGAAVLIVYVIFWFNFKETPVVNKDSVSEPAKAFIPNGTNSKLPDSNSFSWVSAFKHRLSYPLTLLSISGFMLGVGVSMSHSFIMPLFFYHKFSVSYVLVALIIALHRFALGLPMIMGSKVVNWNLKKTIVIFVVIQGVFIALTAVPSSFAFAAVLWLMHDVAGASIWFPARNTLIQHYARNGSRGIDVGMVLAWQELGWVFGPLIVGVVSKYSINYPFFGSGLIVMLSIVPMFWLEYHAKEHLPVPTPI